MTVTVAHLSLPKPGERANGDAVLVRSDGSRRTLLAVVAGLGHGPLAAEAAGAAIKWLEAMPLETRVLEAMQSLHQTLRESRGAVATICSISQHRVEACAVGNVQLLCSNASVPLV